MSGHGASGTGGESGPWVGRPMKRVEDRPLLLGVGHYTDDVVLPGTTYLHVIRSPHAHARIMGIDTAAARALPGVLAVVTGADVRGLGHLKSAAVFPNTHHAPHPILADGVAWAVGEAVAAVVAETAAIARDAAERVVIEWQPQPPMVEPEDALAPSAPTLHSGVPGNLAFQHRWRTGDVPAGFTGAAAAVRLRVEQPPISAVAVEPRSVLARYEKVADELTVWCSTQAPFRIRADIAASLGFNESRLRVVAPDVGGGFGVKGSTYREEVLAAWLAMRLARPVKWIATRGEDLLVTHHGRGGHGEGELAVDGEGRIRALRASIRFPLGPYLRGPMQPWNYARTMPGAYVVPAVDIDAAGAYTTTPPTGAYRGAGRPEGIFLIERLMDQAARALGLDPAEIRRRNFIPADAFPYRTATGCVYDSGDYRRAFDKALALADYPRLRKEQAAARAGGAITGIGLCAYIEPSAAGWESGSVRFERTGSVTVVTGSSPHGQGHETTWAQIVADVLSVHPSVVTVRHGDTRGAPQGFGTFGSRSTALAGGALVRAATVVREKGQRIAAQMLEAAPADVRLASGGFQVTGVPGRAVAWRQIADAAYRGVHLADGDDPGLDASVFFKAESETWSFGTCVATVDVDRDTGRVRLGRVVWVDDAGTLVNPLLVEGQLHGSYAQGAGQALFEGILFDEGGQVLTASLMDYAVPRADDLPEPELETTVTRSTRNPLGVKGVGEAGCIAVPPAIVNAVVDALAPWGCTHLDMPITAQKVWRVLQSGG
jgi:carbon-monoxide dehydrogenase large subunit